LKSVVYLADCHGPMTVPHMNTATV